MMTILTNDVMYKFDTIFVIIVVIITSLSSSTSLSHIFIQQA